MLLVSYDCAAGAGAVQERPSREELQDSTLEFAGTRRGLSPLPPAARRTIKFLIFGRDLSACSRRFEKEEQQLRWLLCHVAHVRDKCRTKHVLAQLGESCRVSRRLHGFYRRSYAQIVNFRQRSEKREKK